MYHFRKLFVQMCGLCCLHLSIMVHESHARHDDDMRHACDIPARAELPSSPALTPQPGLSHPSPDSHPNLGRHPHLNPISFLMVARLGIGRPRLRIRSPAGFVDQFSGSGSDAKNHYRLLMRDFLVWSGTLRPYATLERNGVTRGS